MRDLIPAACPFCQLMEPDCLLESKLACVIQDAYPVSPGHLLVVPRRHVEDFFALQPQEVQAMMELVWGAKELLSGQYRPDGFNVGINVGAAAGQTIAHVHIHLIARYRGDVADPRGGVRAVIPGKSKYGIRG